MELYSVFTDNFFTVYGHEVFFSLCKYMTFRYLDSMLVVTINHPDVEEIIITVKPNTLNIYTCGDAFNFLELKEALEEAILTRWYDRNIDEFSFSVSKKFFGVK